MPEKFSVLIKYKYLDYIDNAGLSDSDAWALIRSVVEYDRDGTAPDYQNPVLYGLFAVLKNDIDSNRKKWEEASAVKSRCGKMGGAKKGNQNARKRKDSPEQPEQAPACFAAENKLDKQKQHDYDLDLDLGYDLENGGGGKDSPQPTRKNETKTHPVLLKAKADAEARLLFLDDRDMERLVSGVDPTWFGENGFIDFIAETVREKGYEEKPRAQRHNLFRSLLFDAPNLRAEYPHWRVGKENPDMSPGQAHIPKPTPAITDGDREKGTRILDEIRSGLKHGRTRNGTGAR